MAKSIAKLSIASSIEEGAVVRKLVAECPYREGTKRAKRFAAYRDGVKVETIITDKRVNIDGFRGDIHRGYIQLVRPSKRTKKAA